MVVVVFRSRAREDVDTAAVERAGAAMYELAAAMPGFVSYRDYAAADGEWLTLVEFESHETLAAWRDHPEHVRIQQWGREAVFESYRIAVCDTRRSYRFSRAEGRVEPA